MGIFFVMIVYIETCFFFKILYIKVVPFQKSSLNLLIKPKPVMVKKKNEEQKSSGFFLNHAYFNSCSLNAWFILDL